MAYKHTDKFTPKAYLRLHQIGSKYMLVESTDDCANLTNVYSLNDTAAWLWQRVCAAPEQTPEELAANMCRTYDVEYGRALQDVTHQLEEWIDMGLI